MFKTSSSVYVCHEQTNAVFLPMFLLHSEFLEKYSLRPNLPVAEPCPTGGIEASSFGNSSVYSFQCGWSTLVMAAYEKFAKHPLPMTFD